MKLHPTHQFRASLPRASFSRSGADLQRAAQVPTLGRLTLRCPQGLPSGTAGQADGVAQHLLRLSWADLGVFRGAAERVCSLMAASWPSCVSRGAV